MANNTVKIRVITNYKLEADWESSTIVPLMGEQLVSIDKLHIKYGDGVNTWKDLPFANVTPSEVQSLIDKNKYILPTASDTTLGGVKIGTNVNISSGTISINNASTSQKGVVQLSDAVNSTSTTLAATANAVKKAYDQANKMVPIAGGVTMTGLLTLSGNPTADMGAATKLYVDSQITDKLKTADAMVYKGTLGTNGTIINLPTANVIRGDTYKVITAGTYAGYACKIGDLLIANSSGSLEANSTNWSYVPSGNERETTIRYATSGVNLTTSAQTGNIIIGAAAIKQVDTSISAGSTSSNLPTTSAVAAFVESKGYQTKDEKVLNTLNSTQKAYITGTTSTTTNTGTQVFDTGVYLGDVAGELFATTFRGVLVGNVTGNVSGNAGSADKWKTGRKLTLTGDVTGNVTWDGSVDASLSTIVADDSHNHTKFNCVDITGQTVNLNNYNLSSGIPHKIFYIEKTSGGATNISNTAVSGQAFTLMVELIRYVSNSDYVTKQTFTSASDKSTYERWCTNGTWSSWLPVARFSGTPVSNRILIADGTSGAIKSSGYTVGAAAAKGVTDSSSASAIGTGTSLPTERDVYYGLPTINTVHNYTSSTTLFAPVSGGTSGQILKSEGNAAPVWINQSSITAGKATVLETKRNFSITGNATASVVSFSGDADVSLNVTVLNAMGLRVNSGDTLILDGSL